jgi:excisionase family DNA binding protein
MVENTEPIQKPAISSGSGLMSVKKMGSQLGLKKTESYRLIHMGFFETIELFGKTWIDRDSFEAWYANHVHYVKTEGEAPGKRLTEKSYSVKEISGLLGISEGSVYDLIKKNCFETIQTNGQRRIDKDDFDRWYANQTRYQAVTDKEKYTQAAPRQEALDKEGAGTDGGCCDTTCMVDKTTFNVPSGSVMSTGFCGAVLTRLSNGSSLKRTPRSMPLSRNMRRSPGKSGIQMLLWKH